MQNNNRRTTTTRQSTNVRSTQGNGAINNQYRGTGVQGNRAVNSQYRGTTGVQESRVASNQPIGAGSQYESAPRHMVTCRKCKSTQIVANKRGYKVSNLFKTLAWMVVIPVLLLIFLLVLVNSNASFGSLNTIIGYSTIVISVLCWISLSLSIPVAIIMGFVGSGQIINGCMNCGFRWSPFEEK